MSQDIRPVMLVGGAGTRLAPLSTADCPKPFLPLPAGGSLLQHSLHRLRAYLPPLLVGQAAHRDALSQQARDAGIAPAAFLLEPAMRNTAMAVAVAVAQQMAEGQAGQMLALLPADRAIAEETLWHDALCEAAILARAGSRLALIGMGDVPPSPGLGYMRVEAGIVTAFREKPIQAAALAREGWLANSGLFVGEAAVFARFIAQHAPLIWQAAMQAVACAHREGNRIRLGEAAYASVLPMAFDRAVIEKASGVAAVATACGWHDIGTLAAFCAHACRADGASQSHARSEHPWGYAEPIAERAESLAKRLTLYPGQRLSLQRHRERAEAWLVTEGEALVWLDGERVTLAAGEAICIPRQSWHRLVNAGAGMLRVLELQLGLCDEADIERAEDDYGRV